MLTRAIIAYGLLAAVGLFLVWMIWFAATVAGRRRRRERTDQLRWREEREARADTA